MRGAVVHYGYHFALPAHAACCGRDDLDMTYKKKDVTCQRCRWTVSFQEHGENDIP